MHWLRNGFALLWATDGFCEGKAGAGTEPDLDGGWELTQMDTGSPGSQWGMGGFLSGGFWTNAPWAG